MNGGFKVELFLKDIHANHFRPFMISPLHSINEFIFRLALTPFLNSVVFDHQISLPLEKVRSSIIDHSWVLVESDTSGAFAYLYTVPQ